MPPPDAVLELYPLGFPWKSFDPFLFCVHHLDAYPQGNGRLGPSNRLQLHYPGNEGTMTT